MFMYACYLIVNILPLVGFSAEITFSGDKPAPVAKPWLTVFPLVVNGCVELKHVLLLNAGFQRRNLIPSVQVYITTVVRTKT